MDITVPPYSKDRFDYIKSDLGEYLYAVLHYKQEDVVYIPVSAYQGINIQQLPVTCSMSTWIHNISTSDDNNIIDNQQLSNMNLIQLLEYIPTRHELLYNEPLRCVILNTVINGGNTLELYIHVITGCIRKKSMIAIMNQLSNSDTIPYIQVQVINMYVIPTPSSASNVNSNNTNNNNHLTKVDVNLLVAGQYGYICVKYDKNNNVNTNSTNSTNNNTATIVTSANTVTSAINSDAVDICELLQQNCVYKGNIITKGKSIQTLIAHTQYQCMVYILPTCVMPILPGSSLVLYSHGQYVECTITKLCSIINTNTTNIHTNTDIKCLYANQHAIIQLTTASPFILESVKCKSICQYYCRFILRYNGYTIGMGVCQDHM